MQIGNRRDGKQSGLSTSIILFEEHALVRSALTQNLYMQPDIKLLDVFTHLPSRPESILQLNPEVVLIGFPQHSIANIQTLSNFVKVWANAGIAVIVSTPFLKVEEEKYLFDSGIFAYIHKTIDGDRLRAVIEAAKAFYRLPVDP